MNNPLSSLAAPILLAGIGNTIKGDDGAGLVLIAAVKATDALRTLDCGEMPENYLKQINASDAKTVVLVDAADMGEQPGAVRLIPATEIQDTGISTHGMSLRMLAEFIRSESGKDVFLLGIQPATLGLGEGLSPAVARAVDMLAQEINRAK